MEGIQSISTSSLIHLGGRERLFHSRRGQTCFRDVQFACVTTPERDAKFQPYAVALSQTHEIEDMQPSFAVMSAKGVCSTRCSSQQKASHRIVALPSMCHCFSEVRRRLELGVLTPGSAYVVTCRSATTLCVISCAMECGIFWTSRPSQTNESLGSASLEEVNRFLSSSCSGFEMSSA